MKTPSTEPDYQLWIGDSTSSRSSYYVRNGSPISFGGDQNTYDAYVRTYSINKDWLIQHLHESGSLAPEWESKLYGSSVSTCDQYRQQKGIISSVTKTQVDQAFLDFQLGIINQACYNLIADAYFGDIILPPITPPGTNSLQLKISGHTDIVQVTSGTQHNIQVITSPLTSGMKINIKNISDFPDTILQAVVTDDYGEALTYFVFDNPGPGMKTIEIQAFPDGYTFTNGSNIVTVQISPITPPITPPGGTMIINTQKNLSGTVEIVNNYMIWHITSPITNDISYGLSTDVPATWIDETGNEQMALIRADQVYLDTNLSGGNAEIMMPLSNVNIVTVPGKTTQIKPKGTNMVTIQIKTIGNGQVKSSGGDNPLAVRNNISVPAGYSVYFEAVPSSGESFQKFVSADGVDITTNPVTLQANVDGSITAVFSGTSPPPTSTDSTTTILVITAGLILAYILLNSGRK